ncbi:Osmotin thaumatin-like protein [Stereum hirsutum FP-91666 SS1]|uniref:Osmotin thaumatin-like protein n=1 Tax=Stereum hirsutum (strain FP-91666) TaxID=721885 RepID=R7RYD4_STEHR|nr:Osmotin thaumatin-like protein [Stereum hirsutum FP-91666 SS1]EIM80416.1 Osmotin thaumatin-like protein [Stereum hirsutum FP-91666 SS1]
MKAVISLTLLAAAASVSAFTIEFVNNCDYTVWPAVGKAPNGVPDTSVAYGVELEAGDSQSFSVDDTETGIRAWGRTGCDSNGDNCQTGACVGGLVCTDAGITAGVILSEFGYADFGTEWGGERTSWDLSMVDSDLNIDTSLTVSDGQSVSCTSCDCSSDDAYTSSTDYSADRNSDLGLTYTHTFCA